MDMLTTLIRSDTLNHWQINVYLNLSNDVILVFPWNVYNKLLSKYVASNIPRKFNRKIGCNRFLKNAVSQEYRTCSYQREFNSDFHLSPINQQISLMSYQLNFWKILACLSMLVTFLYTYNIKDTEIYT